MSEEGDARGGGGLKWFGGERRAVGDRKKEGEEAAVGGEFFVSEGGDG